MNQNSEYSIVFQKSFYSHTKVKQRRKAPKPRVNSLISLGIIISPSYDHSHITSSYRCVSQKQKRFSQMYSRRYLDLISEVVLTQWWADMLVTGAYRIFWFDKKVGLVIKLNISRLVLTCATSTWSLYRHEWVHGII